ncbi:MAG TPA: VOC family protein [Pyrinomonadaceae bacterium]|nr:VOC family protein [Pyrinomonadaceae bacterium]
MKRKFAFVVILIILGFILFYVGFQPKRKTVKEARMFQGLRTVIYHVEDLAKAKEWYSNLLGIKPYFDEPFYVGFNVGGYELGLDPDAQGITRGGNVVAYWGVADARAAYRHAQELGATKHTDPQEVGGGIIVATVTDPFGNLFGIIENPNFKAEEGATRD